MVDLGITFPEGENDPGVDVILPDLRFIEEEKARLAGLVLTHGHEDHIGAVIELWPRLKVPIYATPFTAALLQGQARRVRARAEAADQGGGARRRFEVGPFDLELISVAHSIPESNALAVRTPLGLALHTGDWKIDPTPVIGPPTDGDRLSAARRRGRDGHDLRFHQRAARGPLAVRAATWRARWPASSRAPSGAWR